jgi:hypothetical protein
MDLNLSNLCTFIDSSTKLHTDYVRTHSERLSKKALKDIYGWLFYEEIVEEIVVNTGKFYIF